MCIDAPLVPVTPGIEVYEVSGAGAKAFAGTGYNADNPQHTRASDAVRWAIALQQLRDRGDYAALDAARSTAEKFYFVMQERDGTRLLTKPVGWNAMGKSARKHAKASATMAVTEGLIDD